jgi:hypothetical protein
LPWLEDYLASLKEPFTLAVLTGKSAYIVEIQGSRI